MSVADLDPGGRCGGPESGTVRRNTKRGGIFDQIELGSAKRSRHSELRRERSRTQNHRRVMGGKSPLYWLREKSP